MASPLSIFRKYQTVLLVVFGVVLMVAFVVAPSVLEYQRSASRGGGPENAVVVDWRGGELRESDLASLRRNRALVGPVGGPATKSDAISIPVENLSYSEIGKKDIL